MIRVAGTIHINRPAAEVFNYAVRPENSRDWRRGVIEAKQISDGPLGVGARVLQVRYQAGRRLESIARVTAYESAARYWSADEKGEPYKVEGGMVVEEQDGGTTVTYEYSVQLGRWLRLIQPLAARVFRGEVTKDFQTLKSTLEARDGVA